MEKRKRSNLEVTCIGALYQGAWQKKYWSSSRGKDRYPYPVGYQAVRCYNGHSFHMEVHEGGRGPLFVVSFGEGMTFSGDTPTIAWQRALKKTSALSKKLPRRFLSTEINGSELFGFLDPLVQRLFRELVSSQDGEAQSDDVFSPNNKAEKVLQQNSTRLDSLGGFGWGSTRRALVRKPRTSIVHPGTNISNPCRKSSSNHFSQSGGRKRLKLAKPTKEAREDTGFEPTAPSNLTLLQHGSADLSQWEKQGEEQKIMSAKSPQDQTCLGESTKTFDLVQELQKKDVLQGAIVPDSFDEFPSQFSNGCQGMQTKLSLVNIACNEGNRSVVPSCATDACLPSQGLPPNFSNAGACDNLECFKEDIHINSSPVKLNSLSRDALKVQFTSTVVPDSCDNDSSIMQINGAYSTTQAVVAANNVSSVMQINGARSSTQAVVAANNVSSVMQINGGRSSTQAVVPDSYNNDSSIMQINSARSSTQAVVAVSEIVDEHIVTEADKCHNLPACDAKDESPSSEGNTQRGEADSLGQELTKSMIRLLLPQALQFINKKKRKRKKPTNLKAVNRAEVELPNKEDILAGTNENKCDFTASLPNQAEHMQVQDCQNIPREGLVSMSTKEQRIYSGTERLELQIEDLDHASTCSRDYLKVVDEGGLEKVDRVNGEPSNDSDLCNAQLPRSRECFNADSVNLVCQQAQRDVDHQLESCTVVSCDKTVLSHKFSLLESSAPQSISLPKQQDYDVNDAASAPLLLASCKSHFAGCEYVSLPGQYTPAGEHSCPEHSGLKEICLPSSKSWKSVDFTEFSTSIEEVTVEKSAMQHEANNPLQESGEANHCSDASATGNSVSEVIAGENLCAAPSAFSSNKLLQKHSVESTVVKGLSNCQELNDNHSKTKCGRDGCVELLTKDSLQTEIFVPKACLEHPMPVLTIKINAQDDQVHLFICCGVQNNASRVLFIYQTTKKEFKASLISSIAFDILDYMCDAVCQEHVEANGIQFTPGGQELILLSMFIVRETKEEDPSLVQKHRYIHGLQVVSYADGQNCIRSRLDTSGRHVYCVLLLDTCMVIAGGDNGFVSCWTMDALWRSCKDKFTLPVPEGHQFSRIIQLSGVPALPWIAIGSDHRGAVAIWNSASRQLLRASKFSVQLPLEIHLVNIDMVVQSSCGALMNLWRKDGNDVSEKVAASFLVRTLDCSRTAYGESDGQAVFKSWSLELFRRNGTSAVLELDQVCQSVSAIEVLDGVGVAGTNDGYVHLWDLRSGSVTSTFSELKGDPIACIARDPACSILAVAGSSGRVLIYAKEREPASTTAKVLS